MSDLSAIRDEINAAVQTGNVAHALTRLDAALSAAPQRADIRMLRVMVLLSLNRYSNALEDLDLVLLADPNSDSARFQRAVTLFGQERLGEALDDFMLLSQRRPETVEPWANAGVILLRMQRPAEAIPLLREAVRLRPDSVSLRRSLANALSGIGVVNEAIQLYESAIRESPDDPASLTDYAMALLAMGKPGPAHAQLLAALRIDRSDQTALAGIYLSANELGLHDVVDRLTHYSALLWVGMRPDTATLDREALRSAVLAHPGLVWQPAGRSTHHGHQSPMLDLSPGSPFAAFGQFVHQVVGERLTALRSEPSLRGHPWMMTLPMHWHLQAWCTVLDSGGRQTPHIHPAGRLSGVYYLDTGNASQADAGTLVFGHAPDDIKTSARPRVHSISPKNDQICLFPSYFFHHTEPFQGTHGPRISLAFDVIPGP